MDNTSGLAAVISILHSSQRRPSIRGQAGTGDPTQDLPRRQDGRRSVRAERVRHATSDDRDERTRRTYGSGVRVPGKRKATGRSGHNRRSGGMIRAWTESSSARSQARERTSRRTHPSPSCEPDSGPRRRVRYDQSAEGRVNEDLRENRRVELITFHTERRGN